MEQYDTAITRLRSIPEQYRSKDAWICLAEALCMNVRGLPRQQALPSYQEAMYCLEHVAQRERRDPAWVASMVRARSGLGELAPAMRELMAWKRAHLETYLRNDRMGVAMVQAAESEVLAALLMKAEQTIYGDSMEWFRSQLPRIFGPKKEGPMVDYGQGDFYCALWFFSAVRTSRRFGVLVTEATGPHGAFLPDGTYPTERFELLLTLPPSVYPFSNSSSGPVWTIRAPTMVSEDFLRLPTEKRLVLPTEEDSVRPVPQLQNQRFPGHGSCMASDPGQGLPSALRRTGGPLPSAHPPLPGGTWPQTFGLKEVLPRLQKEHIAREDRPSALTPGEKAVLQQKSRS